MIEQPLFYLVAIVVVLMVGAAKSGFGGGLGIVAVPLLSLVITPPQAIAILLPILCLMDLFGFWAYRKSWHARNLAIMIPGALFGIVLGTMTFHLLDEGMLRILVGVIAVGFALHYYLRVPESALCAQRLIYFEAVSGRHSPDSQVSSRTLADHRLAYVFCPNSWIKQYS